MFMNEFLEKLLIHKFVDESMCSENLLRRDQIYEFFRFCLVEIGQIIPLGRSYFGAPCGRKEKL